MADRPSHERLKPATPFATVEGRGFGPRIPWKWVLGPALLLALGGGGLWVKNKREGDQVRAEVLARMGTGLAPGVERYRSFRSKLEGWAQAAAKENPPTPAVDARLDLSALHKAEGVYLRLKTDDAKDAASIEAAARRMHPDAITRCLGVAPTSLKGFYDQGAFLMPAWLEAVRREEDTKKLIVKRDDLALRVGRDLPGLLRTTQAQYFLLAVERAATRQDAPVDIFLWDLRSGTRLLALRTVGAGEFITVHVGGGPRSKIPEGSGAADCSIAMQVKDAVDAAQAEAPAAPAPAPSPQ